MLKSDNEELHSHASLQTPCRRNSMKHSREQVSPNFFWGTASCIQQQLSSMVRSIDSDQLVLWRALCAGDSRRVCGREAGLRRGKDRRQRQR